MMTSVLSCVQVLNKVITVYAALCSEVKKLKHEVWAALLWHYFGLSVSLLQFILVHLKALFVPRTMRPPHMK